MKTRCLALFGLVRATCFAQLSTDQRLADFRNLGDLYARRYAGIEWKKAAVNFNLLDLTPWYTRVSKVNSDLDFYDLMVEYVSSLSDAHDQYYLPSDFEPTWAFRWTSTTARHSSITSIEPNCRTPSSHSPLAIN